MKLKVTRDSVGTWTAAGYGFRFESRTLKGLFDLIKKSTRTYRSMKGL